MSTEKEVAGGQNEAALAASAHSRINVPLNLENWQKVPRDVADDLMWFHQHALDEGLNWKEAGQALNYEQSTVFRVLKGTYEGSWGNVGRAIASYKRIVEERGHIQKSVFVENGIYRLVAGGLEYALANNSVTMVIGESRMGKSAAVLHWRDLNNHGRSVYVVAPPYGGTKALLRRIGEAVGVNRNQATPALMEAVCRSFNKHRILVVDEAHRLLPSASRWNPTNLEVLRDLHDTTGCALALVATQRFSDDLQKSQYMFEQLLGRIGMPVRLPRKIHTGDFRGIVEQYVRGPEAQVMGMLEEIANAPGRLGILVETLKVAARLADKKGEKTTGTHVVKAIAARRMMMGETMWAKA